MTALVWDEPADRRYETGVSHGVLYPPESPGVVWNGLISVSKRVADNDHKQHYMDGISFLDSISNGYCELTVHAFDSPKEFCACEGLRAIVPGFYLGKQPKQRFNFSYQTKFSDGYKIHLVYNNLASSLPKSYITEGNSTNPSTFGWIFNSIPVFVEGIRPFSYFVVNSTKASLEFLSNLEEILYGTEETEPSFPSIDILISMASEV